MISFNYTPLLVILVFILAALREGLSVFFVHYTERNKDNKVGLIAAVQASAEIAGIGLSIRSLPCAGAYVFGHYAGVRVAMWRKRKTL